MNFEELPGSFHTNLEIHLSLALEFLKAKQVKRSNQFVLFLIDLYQILELHKLQEFHQYLWLLQYSDDLFHDWKIH